MLWCVRSSRLAARVATSSEARGRGAVISGENHAARFVMKTNTTAFDAFSSHESRAMGDVGETVSLDYDLAPLPEPPADGASRHGSPH